MTARLLAIVYAACSRQMMHRMKRMNSSKRRNVVMFQGMTMVTSLPPPVIIDAIAFALP